MSVCAAKINGEMSGVKAAVSGGIASQLWIVVRSSVFKFEAFSEISPYPRLALFVDRLLVIKQHLTMRIIFSNFNILS